MALPKSPKTYTLAELLKNPETTWLDWKQEFPAGVLGGKNHPKRIEHRGKMLKTLVSIANSITDQHGYLVYGVDDNVASNNRTVVGVVESFDDADFQTWNADTFSPAIRFHFRFETHGEKTVGLFDVEPSSEFPHVCKANVGDVLHEGQVWFRRGSRNTIATHSDLRNLFASEEPIETEQSQITSSELLKHISREAGAEWELVWDARKNLGECLATGKKIAYYPGCRRQIQHRNNVLLLRKKQ